MAFSYFGLSVNVFGSPTKENNWLKSLSFYIDIVTSYWSPATIAGSLMDQPMSAKVQVIYFALTLSTKEGQLAKYFTLKLI